MEDVLRQLLLVFGGLAIIGILLHGIWTIRRKNQAEKHNDYESDYQTDEIQDLSIDLDDPLLDKNPSLNQQYDDLGLGEVRIVESAPDSDVEITHDAESEIDFDADTVEDAEILEESSAEAAAKPRIYSQVVTQPKPEYEAEQKQALQSVAVNSTNGDANIPEPPAFLLRNPEDMPSGNESTDKDAQAPVKSADEKQQKVKKARLKVDAITSPGGRKRKEPTLGDDQMKIDFGVESQVAPTGEQPSKQSTQQEVLVLNVKAKDDAPIPGAALLPMLLTLGFKFGDKDIFHRHVNSNGKGPVLFSLANMFKPGVFDIDNLENFSTQGISLFMILPIEGDPHQVFNMMHNAARKIAEEFSAQILDGRRSALTKQSLQQYVEKIREFERQRMIAR